LGNLNYLQLCERVDRFHNCAGLEGVELGFREVQLGDFGSEGEQGAQDVDDHQFVVFVRVLFVVLEGVVGQREAPGFGVVDKIKQLLVDAAADDHIQMQ
jgi:hypothetical protein